MHEKSRRIILFQHIDLSFIIIYCYTMQVWEPVLQEEYVSHARQIIQAIEKKITHRFADNQNIGLHQGMAGQLLFLSEYGYTGTQLQGYIELLLSRITDTPNINGGFFNGLAGVGFALSILKEKIPIVNQELLEEISSYVRRFARQDINNSNYDLLHGYLGQCYFLLQGDTKNDLNSDLFQYAIDNLTRIAFQSPHGIGWSNAIDINKFYPNGATPSDLAECCNIGLAHGSPGIIMVLTEMAYQYPELPLKNLIGEAQRFLFYQESEEDAKQYGFYYRGYAGKAGQISRGPLLAWCYSDLGISLIYFRLWEITKQEIFWEKAYRLASLCAKRNAEDTIILSSGICHGAAGIAHMFNKIYQITKENQFKEASNYWFKQLFERFIPIVPAAGLLEVTNQRYDWVYFQSDNDILEGLSGIGLCLISALGERYSAWDRLLLI